MGFIEHCKPPIVKNSRAEAMTFNILFTLNSVTFDAEQLLWPLSQQLREILKMYEIFVFSAIQIWNKYIIIYYLSRGRAVLVTASTTFIS